MHGHGCRYVGDLALRERSKDSLDRLRDVGERALTAGGIHLASGIKLWDAYRYSRSSSCLSIAVPLHVHMKVPVSPAAHA